MSSLPGVIPENQQEEAEFVDLRRSFHAHAERSTHVTAGSVESGARTRGIGPVLLPAAA